MIACTRAVGGGDGDNYGGGMGMRQRKIDLDRFGLLFRTRTGRSC